MVQGGKTIPQLLRSKYMSKMSNCTVFILLTYEQKNTYLLCLDNNHMQAAFVGTVGGFMSDITEHPHFQIIKLLQNTHIFR